MHVDVLRETHGLKHLGTEHPAVPHLNPPVQHWVERENLKGRLHESTMIRISAQFRNRTHLGVGVICGFKADVFDSHLAKEYSHET